MSNNTGVKETEAFALFVKACAETRRCRYDCRFNSGIDRYSAGGGLIACAGNRDLNKQRDVML
jgi:hypothetical protein